MEANAYVALSAPTETVELARHSRTPFRRWAKESRFRIRTRSTDLVRPLAEKANVWLANHSGLLHRLAQAGRGGKLLGLLEVCRGKQQDHLVGVVNAAQEVLLLQTGALTLSSMGIISWLPLGKISDFVTD